MQMQQNRAVLKESTQIYSENLNRSVSLDFYLPTQVSDPREMSLLLINDGQDLEKAGLKHMAQLPSMIIRGEAPKQKTTLNLFLKSCFPISAKNTMCRISKRKPLQDSR